MIQKQTRDDKMSTTEKNSFLKNHADTLAIIGVNIAIGAILISMWVSNTNRIDATNTRIDASNARMDQVYQVIMDMMKDKK